MSVRIRRVAVPVTLVGSGRPVRPPLPPAESPSLATARSPATPLMPPSPLAGPAAPFASQVAAGVVVQTRRRPGLPPFETLRPAQVKALAAAGDAGGRLAEAHRRRLEPIVGPGLGEVRIHTGKAAQNTAEALGAEAFTVGRDVFFARGRYDPASLRGQALLAHELTHVRQQAGLSPVGVRGYGGEAGEAEAEAAEQAVLREGQLGSGDLTVGRYARYYAAADGRPLAPADRARLDAISLRALEVCRQLLAPELGQVPATTLARVRVDVSLDLAALGDGQAAEVWGQALADAIRAQASPRLQARALVEALASAALESVQRSPDEGAAQAPPVAPPESGGLAPGEKYRAQLAQLETLIGERQRTRAITAWAVDYFQGEHDVAEIARALTAKVDDALFAVNAYVERPGEVAKSLFMLDLTWWLEAWRRPIDYAANLYLERSLTPWLLTYRIPKAAAVAMTAVEDVRGKCEEHAFTTIYLLTVGHMIQNMPFGRLKGDIYYAGAGLNNPGVVNTTHAVVVLVKGSEFKEAILASARLGKKKGQIDVEWLMANTALWGPNAWIVDGWTGEARPLATNPVNIDWGLSQTFRRNVVGQEKPPDLPSEWDTTIDQLAERVAADYGLYESEPATEPPGTEHQGTP